MFPGDLEAFGVPVQPDEPWVQATIHLGIKLLEENIGKTLSDIHHSRILYDPPPRILEIKAKIKKWDLNKIKSFCKSTSGLLSRSDMALGVPMGFQQESQASSCLRKGTPLASRVAQGHGATKPVHHN